MPSQPNALASTYQTLDINQKINLKGMVSRWLQITRERFQAEIEKKVYGRKRGRRKRALRQSRQLLSSWTTGMTMQGNSVQSASLSFLLYGRFVDMGVGPEMGYALSQYQKVRRNGEKRTRLPAKWYSRRKGHETHRLRELLVKHHITIPVETIENALTQTVNLTMG